MPGSEVAAIFANWNDLRLILVRSLSIKNPTGYRINCWEKNQKQENIMVPTPKGLTMQAGETDMKVIRGCGEAKKCVSAD